MAGGGGGVKIFFASGDKGALTPLTKILQTLVVVTVTCGRRIFTRGRIAGAGFSFSGKV